MNPTFPSLFENLLQEWQQLLNNWASSGTLSRSAQEALLLEGEPEQLLDLVSKWTDGDFSNLPPVVLLPAGDMPGAAGAYAISTGTIYLNQDWLQAASREQALAVLTEELGHHLDGLLNASDTPGDEGELFGNAVITEEHFETSPDSSCRYSDMGVIYVNNSWADAEFSHEYQSFASRMIRIEDLAHISSATLDGNSILIGGRSSVADIEISQANANFGYIGSIGKFANIPTSSELVPASRGETIYDLDITPEGGIYTFGRSLVGFDASTQFRGPYYDVTLSKYDSAGGLVWSRTTGNFLWNNPQSAAPDNAAAMAIDAAGNTYIAGTTYRVIGSNPFSVFWGDPTGFVVSYSPEGNLRWTALLGSYVEPVDLLLHPNGDVYLTGSAYRDYDRHSFLARLNGTNGEPAWLQLFGAPPSGFMAAGTPDIGNALAVDQPGMIYVAGTSTTAPFGDTGYIAKFSPDGTSEWSRFLTPGQQISTAKSIAVDFRGQVNVFGEARRVIYGSGSYSIIEKDLYTAALDSNGNHIVYSITETVEDEVAHKIMAGQDGSVFTVGSFLDSLGRLQVLIGSNVSNAGSASFTISGLLSPGNYLHAALQSSDPDGNGSFTYSWQTSSNGSTWSTVGSSRSSYRLTANDAGKQLRLLVSYRDGGGFNETVFTAAGTIAYSLTHQILEILAKDIIYKRSHLIGSFIQELPGLPYVVNKVWNDTGTGLYALGFSAPSAPSVLVFRGTGDKLDIWDDLNPDGIGFGQFTAAYDGIPVYDSIRQWLRDQDSTYAPIITGHSLGGSLAQWAAADATGNGAIRLGEVVTFNSPGISPRQTFGAIQFGANIFNSLLAGKVTHYITSSDLISLAGAKYLPGSYKVFDYSSFPDPGIRQHLNPVLVPALPCSGKTKQADSDPVEKPFWFLNSPLYGYNTDIDFIVLRLAIAAAAKIAAAIPGIGAIVASIINSVNKALRSRFDTENLRTSLGEVLYGPGVRPALENAMSIASIAAEAASERVQAAFSALDSGGREALDAIASLPGDVWDEITNATSTTWTALSKWTGNAWRDSVDFSTSVWQALISPGFNFAQPFITTAVKQVFRLPATPGFLPFAATASIEPSTVEDQASPDQPAALRSFSLASFSAPAALQTIAVKVALSQASAELVTLQFQTADRTAQAGVDYLAISGMLQFQPGETEKLVTIELLTPPQASAKDFALRLSNLQNAQFLASEEIVVSLVANQAPVVATAPDDRLAPIEEPLFFALPPGTFSDVNSSQGDSLVVSASLSDGSPLPAWLQFDPETLSFAGIPPALALGSLAIVVTASDSAQGQATASFALRLVANDGAASFTISGTASVGNTLTATHSSPDPDGDGDFTFGWQSSTDGTNWNPVGTNSSNYLVASAEQGKQLRLVVSYTDGQGFSESVTTAAGSVPLVNDGVASFSISGTSAVGNTLVASVSSADPDGNGAFSYSWQASTESSSWSPVGTNSSSYLVASADQGKQLRLVVSYTDLQGFAESVTTAVGTVPFVNDGPASFSITGTPTFGNTFTATTSSTDPDGNGTFSYSWQSSSNGTIWLTVGSQSSLLITTALAGRQLRLQVSYQDGQGFAESVNVLYGLVPLPAGAPQQSVVITALSDNLGILQGPIAEGAISNDTTPTLIGTLSAALGSSETLRVYRNGATAGTATISGLNWTYTPSTPLVGNGIHAFTVAVVKGSGISGQVSDPRSLLLDATAPNQTVTISSVSDNSDPVQGAVAAGGRTNDTTPTISGNLTAPLGAGETIKLYNGNTFLVDAVVDATILTWTATPTLAANGTYTLRARVQDQAGNQGPLSAGRTLIFDTVSPAQTVTISGISDNVGLTQGPIADGGTTNDTTPTLSGTLSTALGTSEVLRVYRGGVLAGNATVNATTRAWSYTPATPLSANGIYVFTAAVVDGAGNVGPLSDPWKMQLEAPISTADRDDLTGTTAADTFLLPQLDWSLLGAAGNPTYDTVTGYQSTDRLQLLGRTFKTRLTSSAGVAPSLAPADIANILTPSWAENSARAFTVTGLSGTFVALNDAQAGYQPASDAILFLRGYSASVVNSIVLV